MSIHDRMRAAALHATAACSSGDSAASVYARHADFVWKTLQRLNVAEPDLEDVLQEVFVVVHRRLESFDGSSQLTTWLFGICLRVVAAHRRRGYRVRERAVESVEDDSVPPPSSQSPERQAMREQARSRLDGLLERLSLEQRAVFTMFELEGASCQQIAALIGVPVGTVHSRLHAARRVFAAALKSSARGEGHG